MIRVIEGRIKDQIYDSDYVDDSEYYKDNGYVLHVLIRNGKDSRTGGEGYWYIYPDRNKSYVTTEVWNDLRVTSSGAMHFPSEAEAYEYISDFCNERGIDLEVSFDVTKNNKKESIVRVYESDDFEPIRANQKYTSAATSINATKLPAVFGMVNFSEGDINLDVGGGRFDNVAKELAKSGVTNLVYDPYNRSDSHNSSVINKIRENGGADSVTCSNVLNVIAELEARLSVIQNCYRFLKKGRPAYFTVYEGDGSGEERETKSGYQLNRKTAEYVDEIEQVFTSVSRKGKLITAIK